MRTNVVFETSLEKNNNNKTIAGKLWKALRKNARVKLREWKERKQQQQKINLCSTYGGLHIVNVSLQAEQYRKH